MIKDNLNIELLPNWHNHAYCYMVYCLGRIFFTAQRLQDKNILDGPYNVSAVFPNVEKFKEADPETNLERWQFVYENFLQTKKGVNITFHNAHDNNADKLIDYHGGFYIWPFKNKWQWNSNNISDYVVLQDSTEVATNEGSNQWRLISQQERIVKELDSLGIKYELVDYKTPIKKLFELLVNCKMLISYYGTSWWFAAGMNVPTITFGSGTWAAMKHTDKIMFAGFEHTKKNFFETPWGHSYVKPWNIFQYDKEKGIYQKRQKYVTNIGEVESQESYKILREKLLM
jgi:hypothetical protein